MAELPDPATPRDKTPYIESEALKKKLSGVKVTATNYTTPREVPVVFIGPDFEVRSAAYPGIYLSYAGMNRAPEREHRGPTTLPYAPPGFPVDVQVPKVLGDPDSTETESWSEDLDPRRSPYFVDEHPIPYNLDFNITVVTRNYQQMFEIIAQLDEGAYLPARFGGLDVPADGTVRTLELLGGPDTSFIKDEDGKRVLQSVYSVRVTAEILPTPVKGAARVTDVDLQMDQFYL